MSTARVDRTIDDAFVDLVSRDDDLVRAEFDALVVACWQDPPPAAPRPHGRPPAWPARPSAERPAPAPFPPPERARRRQRPPTKGR